MAFLIPLALAISAPGHLRPAPEAAPPHRPVPRLVVQPVGPAKDVRPWTPPKPPPRHR